MTAILTCECQHEWQDAQYGSQKRVMNRIKQNDNSCNTYKCTVCGKDKTSGENSKKKK